MAKLSKAEQDRLRRQRHHGPGLHPKAKYVALGIAAIIGIVVLVAALNDDPADTRAANFAAFGLKDDPYLGDPDAALVVVGFESPQCSSCQLFHNQVLPDLNETFFSTGKAVYYYAQFQWGQQGGTEYDGGVAQECAFKHGGREAFWDYTDSLYQPSRNTYATHPHAAALEQLANARGFDADAAVSCYENKDTGSKVSADMRVARDMGASGTPTFFVFGPTGEAVKTSWNALEDLLHVMVEEL